MFYKIYLNTDTRISGDFINGVYQISLPNLEGSTGKNWGIAVESFHSRTANNVPFTIDTNIPLKNTFVGKESFNTLISINSSNFHQTISSNTCGCILSNTLQLYQNARIEIKLKSTMNTINLALPNGWSMCLVIYNIS